MRTFAERHGITPRVQAPAGSPWDKAVAAQGWVLDVGHAAGSVVSVQVADLDELAVGPMADRAASGLQAAPLADEAAAEVGEHTGKAATVEVSDDRAGAV